MGWLVHGTGRLVVASGLLLATGCVDAETRIEMGDPPESLEVQETDRGLLEVGEAMITPKGNRVGLVDVETDRTSNPPTFNALVEACAGKRSTDAAADPRFFGLVTVERELLEAAPPGDARDVALRPLPIAAGECHVGWLTFVLEDGADPAALVLRSRSTAAHWWIGRGRPPSDR